MQAASVQFNSRWSVRFFTFRWDQAGNCAQLSSSFASFGCAVIRSLRFAVICCNR